MDFDLVVRFGSTVLLIVMVIVMLVDLVRLRKTTKRMKGEMVEIKDLGSNEFQLIRPIMYNLRKEYSNGEFTGEWVGSYDALFIMSVNDNVPDVEKVIKEEIVWHAERLLHFSVLEKFGPVPYLMKRSKKHIDSIIEAKGGKSPADLPSSKHVNWDDDFKKLHK